MSCDDRHKKWLGKPAIFSDLFLDCPAKLDWPVDGVLFIELRQRSYLVAWNIKPVSQNKSTKHDHGDETESEFVSFWLLWRAYSAKSPSLILTLMPSNEVLMIFFFQKNKIIRKNSLVTTKRMVKDGHFVRLLSEKHKIYSYFFPYFHLTLICLLKNTVCHP